MAIGFMSFGGMLTGGDEPVKETVKLENTIKDQSETEIDEDKDLAYENNNEIN